MSVNVSHRDGKPRDRQKAETRELLRATAVAILHEQGMDGLKLAAITERAGVARGTFYVHFKNIPELLDDLLESFGEGLISTMVGLPRGTLHELLRESSGRFLDYYSANRVLVEALWLRTAERGIADAAFGTSPLISGAMQSALLQLAPKATDMELNLATQALLALWLRIGLQYIYRAELERDEAVRAIVELSVGALGNYLGISVKETNNG